MFPTPLIIIPFATGGIPLRVMSCLGPAGARFILLSTEPKNLARCSGYCDQFIPTPQQPDGDALEQLLQLDVAELNPILLPVTTKGFEFVAQHRQVLATRFRLPPIVDLERLKLASDKWRLHDFALGHQLPVLPSIQLTSAVIGDVVSGKRPFRFPALIKPSRKENGNGIRKVNSAAELGALYQQQPEIAHDQSLLQAFVDGDDFSLSVYCEKGDIKCHTLWRAVVKSAVPYTIPTCIQFVAHEPVLAVGSRLLKLLEWEGVCDIDLLVDRHSEEIWILEINARFWGNVRSCANGGVNFPELMMHAATGSQRGAWPVQIDGAVFCFAKGAWGGLRHAQVRRAFLRHPLRSTGLAATVRDAEPELRRVQAKLSRMVRKSIGLKVAEEPPP